MAIIDNLAVYYKLDEASGSDVLDAHDSSGLTQVNTVGTATGVIGTARDFEADNNTYCWCADNATISTGDIDFTLQVWAKLESKPGSMVLIGKGSIGGGEEASLEYSIFYSGGSDRFVFAVGTGSADSTVTANTLGSPSTGTWYLIHAWHDSVNNQLGIAVNAGTADTTSYSSGVQDSSSELLLGANAINGAHANGLDRQYDGLLDEAGLWKRVLSSGDRTSLYNAGAGLAYPFGASTALPPRSTFVRQAANRASTY